MPGSGSTSRAASGGLALAGATGLGALVLGKPF
jgi:hypothetical protein